MTKQVSTPPVFSPRVNTMPELLQPAGPAFDEAVAELEQEGEVLDRGILQDLNDQRLVHRLSEAAGATGVPTKEFIRHSSRFAKLDRFGGLFDRSQEVVIPSGDDNVHQDGRPRREEIGYRLDMEYVRSMGVDANRVLFFRATQPSASPKPEYYWTSDYMEAKVGLAFELGGQAPTAVILVSTLADINSNRGLIDDANDDQGIAVRQIGLGNYDQAKALFVLPRDLSADL